MWRIVDPALTDCEKVNRYQIGSWGPKEADRILGDGDSWFLPST
jgi:glucose-6-phosphate 1-dehydrogenase